MRNKGTSMILLGLLLIAVALFLTAYNLYDEQRAEQSALQVIDRLEDYPPSEVPTEASTEPIVEQAPMPNDVPDYVLCPDTLRKMCPGRKCSQKNPVLFGTSPNS